MVIDKICKITIKSVKLKSDSFFSIFLGVWELWRKTVRGGGRIPPPRMDRVMEASSSGVGIFIHSPLSFPEIKKKN